MDLTRQTGRTLHDEHRANLELLGRLEMAVARAPRRDAARDPAIVRLMAELQRQLTQDTQRHFVFEEQELFTRMAQSGDGGIAALLTEEHEMMREVAAELLPLTQAVVAGMLDDAGWAALSRGALEMVERQVSHIQKEEMALLPLLEDLLDDDTDARLCLAYTSS
jgi:hemerythrin-like domain-containing protein